MKRKVEEAAGGRREGKETIHGYTLIEWKRYGG